MSVQINGTNGLTFNDGSSQQTAASGFGFKNRIINGAMMIDQRNAGAVSSGYSVDRWACFNNISNKATLQKSSSAPAGFVASLLITSTSAYSVGAGEVAGAVQLIEGLNIADLAWGTASASSVTLSFWVRSSLTGQFGGALRNSDGSRSYPFAFTINSANTFEYKTVQVAGPTSGTWAIDNTAGIAVVFSAGAGSSLKGTAGAWSTSSLADAIGSNSLVGTSGATFYITGVQLEKGSTATSFDYRPYGTELALCQRYYYCVGGAFNGNTAYQMYNIGYVNTANNPYFITSFPVPMRSAPSFTLLNVGNTLVGSGNTPTGYSLDIASTLTASWYVTGASGQTNGQGTRIYQNNTSVTQLQFAAEL